MALDFYAEEEGVAEGLAAEVLVDEAEGLRGLIASGPTATEILMGMRWHLQDIDRANKTARQDTKRKIRELLVELNNALS